MRDTQKGRKSWLERLTSPPEGDDEQPQVESGPNERSPFDQPGPFEQRGPFEQSGPEAGAPPTADPVVREGFDAFGPPGGLRKPPGPDGPERPHDLPPPTAVGFAESAERGQDRSFAPFDQTAEQPRMQPAGQRGPQDAWDGPVTPPNSDPAPHPGSGPPAPVPGDAGGRSGGPLGLDVAKDDTSMPWRSEPSGTDDLPDFGGRGLGSDRPSGGPLSDSPDAPSKPSKPTTSSASSGPTGPSEDEQLEAARKRHVEELQHRWLVTQAQLLDDPRDAAREAGLLIGDAMQFVTSTFTEHRDRIEREWKNEGSMSTDELRTVMRRYRNLFQYVLSASQLPDL